MSEKTRLQEKRENTLKFHEKLGEKIQDIMDLGWRVTRVTEDIDSQEVEIIAKINFGEIYRGE